jgi:hypothetical protein
VDAHVVLAPPGRVKAAARPRVVHITGVDLTDGSGPWPDGVVSLILTPLGP